MAKLYVHAVQAGEYDDYSVIGVFSTKRKANRVLKNYIKMNGSLKAWIDKWELDGVTNKYYNNLL